MSLFDDDDGYDRLRDDGWTREEIAHREFLDAEGRYRGEVEHRLHETRDPDEALSLAEELLGRVRSFQQEMVSQGIHVGINGRCATCGKVWPCGG